jgi:hypothetical protein
MSKIYAVWPVLGSDTPKHILPDSFWATGDCNKQFYEKWEQYFNPTANSKYLSSYSNIIE